VLTRGRSARGLIARFPGRCVAGQADGIALGIEAARGWFAEDAVADQVAQHGVQGILVAAGRDGQVGDVVVTFGDEVAAVAGSVWRSDRVVASGG